jgi:hypothetical protein
VTTNEAQCVQDLDLIVEIFFFKFTKLQVETHESVDRVHDGPLAGERLCRYIDALSICVPFLNCLVEGTNLLNLVVAVSCVRNKVQRDADFLLSRRMFS